MGSITGMSDAELARLGVGGLIQKLKQCDTERLRLMREQGNMMKDVNKRMQVHLLEIRGLKEVNQKLQEDNQELRDLCCFLDDDRQKGRKLAREWQRFGRYTSSVMRSEVVGYQEKLRELEEKQVDLIQENTELKEMCLLLDQERNLDARDRGDGSSNTSPNVENEDDIQVDAVMNRQTSQSHGVNEQMLHYIKKLETKVSALEFSRKEPSMNDIEEQNESSQPSRYRKFFSTPQLPSHGRTVSYTSQAKPGISNPNISHSPSKPEAVVRALKVLEVHEQLEKTNEMPSDEEDLGDGQKAIVREMCNVVLRKLGDVPPGYKSQYGMPP